MQLIAAGTCGGDGGQLPTPTRVGDLPDELLELVLLRVRTPACLFRAAATCKLWRRVIGGDSGGFLRRFRSRHDHGSHLLLGHYAVTTDTRTRVASTEFVPSPPRPAGAARLRDRLSVDYLFRPGDSHPFSQMWELTDSRDGLLVFVRDNWHAVVCDPWSRQHRVLAFAWQRRPWLSPVDTYIDLYRCIGAFLLDVDAGNGGGGSSAPMSRSSYKVLCACLVWNDYHIITAQARFFSAGDNCWLPPSFSAVVTSECEDMWGTSSLYQVFVGRAMGSIFWAGGGEHMLVLDESALKFSTFRLPSSAPDVYMPCHGENLRVVPAGGDGTGAVRIVRVVHDDVLEVLTARRTASGGWECTVETRVEGLCQRANVDLKLDHRSWCLVDTATAVVALGIRASSSSSTTTTTLVFSIDVETMMLLPANNTTTVMAQRMFPYELPWPQTV